MPPGSTLLPYTTLFRSIVGSAKAGDETAVMGGNQSGAALVKSAFEAGVGVVTDRPVMTQAEADQIAKARLDRKSTRLNSSHITISYAVFCLKKKKKVSD